MLCQKCGLQEAAVLIETKVFRQDIQEHLCALCAGSRKPTAFLPVTPSFSQHGWTSKIVVGAEYDPVRAYLDQIGHTPPLADAKAVTILKRIETAELRAQEILFQFSTLSTYLVTVGEKLISQEEAFHRVIDHRKTKGPRSYLHTLPALVESTRRLEQATAERWREYIKSRTVLTRRKGLTNFNRLNFRLRAQFQKFHYKLKVYDEYIEQLSPVIEEIYGLLGQLRRAKQGETKSDDDLDPMAIRVRLRELKVEYRISPARLMAMVHQARARIREAHQGRTRIIEVYLRLVISIARKHIKPGQPILDVILKGNMGLMRAIEQFDRRHGSAFSLYAARLIRQAIAGKSTSGGGAR